MCVLLLLGSVCVLSFRRQVLNVRRLPVFAVCVVWQSTVLFMLQLVLGCTVSVERWMVVKLGMRKTLQVCC